MQPRLHSKLNGLSVNFYLLAISQGPLTHSHLPPSNLKMNAVR